MRWTEQELAEMQAFDRDVCAAKNILNEGLRLLA